MIMSSAPTSRLFGELPGGQQIEQWTLRGEGGVTLEAITFGGIITRLILPDGRDVVLGFDSLGPYVAGHPYFGALVGRVAGRLTGATFELEGRCYQLHANDGTNTLHGGWGGFDKRVWEATPSVRKDGSPSLRLALTSEDGDQGFPGDLDVAVDYTMAPDNTLLIVTAACTNKATPFSITNHSYFNLGGVGRSEDLLAHVLQVNSSSIVPMREDFTLLDRFEPVNNASDLRSRRRLRQAVSGFQDGHGYLYRTGSIDASQIVARFSYPESGWSMECLTDSPYLQIYTGSHIEEGIRGKGAAVYGKFAGLCLECHNYPNAVNAPRMDIRGVLYPGIVQRSTIAYKFSFENMEASHAADC